MKKGELKQEAIELAGLKRYLNEYTLIKERQAIEVQLFEEYLIYAQIMGIAKKVAKEFKNPNKQYNLHSSLSFLSNVIKPESKRRSYVALSSKPLSTCSLS